jgi:Ca-activated chloride channel homolog
LVKNTALMEMFKFEYPVLVWLFLTLPFVAFFFFLMRHKKKKAILRFGSEGLVRRLSPDASLSRPIIRFVLLITALACLIMGVCGPLIGSRLEEVKRKGADIVVALDVSNSMLAQDLRPSRLERAKLALNRLIDRLEGDRIGLIVFAGDAYVQLPITTDYNAAKLFITTINANMVPRQGTAIGAAIQLARESFSDSTRKHSAILIMTDGENHEDDAVGAAKEAAAAGIKVYTIGMGSPDGAPIPINANGSVAGFQQDNTGRTVITRLDPIMLSEIADAGNGKFIRASASDDGVDLVMKEMAALDRKEFKAKMYTEYENRFQPFVAMALCMLILEFLMGDRKSTLLARLNLFTVHKNQAAKSS